MVTYDSVAPDGPIVSAAAARVVRYAQAVAPLALHAVAVLLYVIMMLCASSAPPRTADTLLMLVMLCVLVASLLRHVTPFLLAAIGHYRYERVSSTFTQLLANTRQSWMIVQTLAVLAGGLPLFLYLFTHYTAKGNLYAVAMFGLPASLGGPVLSICIGLLFCIALAGLLYGLVLLPLKGHNPLYARAPEDRLRTWIRACAWLPLVLLLLILFNATRLLPCDGTRAAYSATEPPYTCGRGAHWFAGLLAWLLLGLCFTALESAVDFVRRLGGQAVTYYALEPRLDGLFCELLVWSLKVTVVSAALFAPLATYVITGCLFLCLFAFTWRWHTATAEVLEELIRWTTAVIVMTCIMSCFMCIGTIPAAVQGCLILLVWALSMAAAVALYYRRFGWVLLGTGRDVTADLIIV